MSKMIGGNTVGLKKNFVDYVCGHFDFASDNVIKNNLFLFVTFGAETENPGFTLCKNFFNIFKCQFAAFCPFTEIASDKCTAVFLLFTDFGDFVCCAEAGISKTFFNKALCNCLINLGTLALGIGTISTFFCAEARNAFVEFNAEIIEAVDDGRNTVIDFTLFIRIFDSEVGNAAR